MLCAVLFYNFMTSLWSLSESELDLLLNVGSGSVGSELDLWLDIGTDTDSDSVTVSEFDPDSDSVTASEFDSDSWSYSEPEAKSTESESGSESYFVHHNRKVGKSMLRQVEIGSIEFNEN
ncbi:hypothetical protein AMATHDRAFT_51291 [Amanita thiersii Skay4041]|uniref:Uncharacterized protein n=1 Tax=Amanita thiersii Skay4041 TaxID=703135 RepID=A0A2A9NCW1_9AGAR|nr:hypothetical protein AMATHDRAFT_51291 [Amanita thiersii Skay4041]